MNELNAREAIILRHRGGGDAQTQKEQHLRKPDWLKRVVPKGEEYMKIKSKLRGLKLATVCEEAKCPNIGECWGGGDDQIATATIMVRHPRCPLPLSCPLTLAARARQGGARASTDVAAPRHSFCATVSPVVEANVGPG